MAPTRAPKTVSDQTIMAAAFRVVRRRGPRFTLVQVGREAGLTAARLVQRYGSRRGLVVAMFREWGMGAVRALDTLALSQTPLASYLQWIRATGRGLGPAQAASSLERILHSRTDPLLRRWYRDHLRAVNKSMTRILTAAVQAGELDATAAQADSIEAELAPLRTGRPLVGGA